MTKARSTDAAIRSSDAPIVVGIDDSEAATLAVRWAAECASSRQHGLRVVHATNVEAMREVFNNYFVATAKVAEEIRADGRRLVDRARTLALGVDPDLAVDVEVSSDSPTRLLVRESMAARLVVVGATGEGAMSGIRFGSTIAAVTQHAHAPVVVVRRTDADDGIRRIGPVVVGVDDSENCEPAITAAFGEAAQRRVELVAVQVGSDLGPPRDIARTELSAASDAIERAGLARLTDRLSPWQKAYSAVTVTPRHYPFAPLLHLMQWSEVAQLIVVGSRGRGGFRGLLQGSTSSGLVQQARCPVMIVGPEQRRPGLRDIVVDQAVVGSVRT